MQLQDVHARNQTHERVKAKERQLAGHVRPRRVCEQTFTPLKGSTEACLQTSKVGDASVMLNHDMGSSGNHFGSSLVTSTFAAARSAAAHGDDFTAFLRLHTLIYFLHLLLFLF